MTGCPRSVLVSTAWHRSPRDAWSGPRHLGTVFCLVVWCRVVRRLICSQMTQCCLAPTVTIWAQL